MKYLGVIFTLLSLNCYAESMWSYNGWQLKISNSSCSLDANYISGSSQNYPAISDAMLYFSQYSSEEDLVSEFLDTGYSIGETRLFVYLFDSAEYRKMVKDAPMLPPPIVAVEILGTKMKTFYLKDQKFYYLESEYSKKIMDGLSSGNEVNLIATDEQGKLHLLPITNNYFKVARKAYDACNTERS